MRPNKTKKNSSLREGNESSTSRAFSKKIQNYKTQILIKYFIKKAGNDNINLESEIQNLKAKLINLNF